MKLFVVDSDSFDKIYLDQTATTRNDLAYQLGSIRFTVNGKYFSVNNVQAEKGSDSTALGIVIGGALGLIGGTPGVLLGSAIGGVLGNGTDTKEERMVDAFNRSLV
ncbi:MAG: hypothetical protein QM504_05015 [Pseudomonadota bacterium]